MIDRLSFKSRKAGRIKRAAFYIRWGRLIRRKRVAYARAQLCDTLKLAQKQMARFEYLAARKQVPVAPMEPLPVVPALPGKEWVECLQGMGELRPVVHAFKSGEVALERASRPDFPSLSPPIQL